MSTTHTLAGLPVIEQRDGMVEGMARVSIVLYAGVKLRVNEYTDGTIQVYGPGDNCHYTWAGKFGVLDTLLSVWPWQWHRSRLVRFHRAIRKAAETKPVRLLEE